ncbi:MarR family transcriptional regulator [Natrinema salaciae]|uniref:MarR family transcriptional regulator n=1 Tax=Natrinema salaciae TaxID=1186196 RepID=UPI000B844BFD
MPIDIERFEDDPVTELRANGRTNAEEMLSFLASSPEQAFTPQEIHEATDVARGSVGVVLSRLENRGLVRHRGEYWAVADDEDLETTLTALATARAATDRLGPEDPAEWGPGVETDGEDQ